MEVEERKKLKYKIEQTRNNKALVSYYVRLQLFTGTDKEEFYEDLFATGRSADDIKNQLIAEYQKYIDGEDYYFFKGEPRMIVGVDIKQKDSNYLWDPIRFEEPEITMDDNPFAYLVSAGGLE